MMTDEDRREALSLAYVQAVAAAAGMTYSTRSRDYGVDVTVHEVARRGGAYFETGWRLDVQAKSTAAARIGTADVAFDLKVKNYADLIVAAPQPRVLVVLALPPDPADWFSQDEDRLQLRKCAYWLSLSGRPAVANKARVRVRIPRLQMFTPAALLGIMARVKQGGTP